MQRVCVCVGVVSVSVRVGVFLGVALYIFCKRKLYIGVCNTRPRLVAPLPAFTLTAVVDVLRFKGWAQTTETLVPSQRGWESKVDLVDNEARSGGLSAGGCS